MLKTKLYPYQSEDVKKLRDLDGTALLASEVGLGKTLIALYYCWRYLPDDPPGPIVAIVPAHLKVNWQREFQKHLGGHAQILYGERVPSGFRRPTDPNQVLIINYDILVPSHWPANTVPAKDSWVQWLAALRPRQIICDESQLCSSPDSARSRAVRWLSKRSARTMMLSGTPLANQPTNLWSPLNTLWPDEFPSLFEFGVAHAYPVRERGRWRFPGARNLPALHEKLKRLGMIRRRKADVIDDLPSISYDVVPLDCDLTEYRRAEADVIAWLEENKSFEAAERATRAEQLTKLNVLLGEASKAKVPAVVEWVRTFLDGSDRKLLLGVVHYAMSDALMREFGDLAVLADGRCSEKKKVKAFDAFNQSPDCRLMVGNLIAAGTGWSCTSSTDVAFAELPWRACDVTQFAGRVHGQGRGVGNRGVQVRFLLAAQTLEDVMCGAIQKKERWSGIAIDGTTEHSELNLQDQLVAYLEGNSE
jgi:SWI/SNF-related matrix-associated actin-dependent regulator 1 of chromatin subfamily A